MSLTAKLKKSVMKISREHKLNHFYTLFKEGSSVLDAGISPESATGLPADNYFLKNYRYHPETYTGLGIDDVTGMDASYPGKHFVQYPGGRFPFSDKQFDWVFSNAVIEHVGNADAQLVFLNEMMRVAKNVFFTTPNKFFPVESHSNAYFLHWQDDIFFRWCEKHKPWLTRDNLYLFSYNRLRGLLKNSNANSFRIYKNRFMGLPMTYTVTCSDKY